MSKHNSLKRLAALMLAVLMTLSISLPAFAAGETTGAKTQSLSFAQADTVPDPRLPESVATETDAQDAAPAFADSDVVRVSIVLETKSTIDAGYEIANIADNKAAMAYRAGLQVEQESLTKRIEATALEGQKLDVVWNLTLAANIISANVKFGKIEAIKNVNGVADVFVETRYAPAVVDEDLPADPNMATSSTQIGSDNAWAAGYTGAGRRIAIIDTGTDYNHQSFDPDAYEYSLSQLAKEAGYDDVEAYKATLNLLTVEEVAGKLDKLNATGYTAEQLRKNSKIPFAYNYVDGNTNTDHMNDTQEEHGSHVSGIAAANSWIPVRNESGEKTGEFVRALDSVMTQGVAPDAQIFTMKVFGAGGGAYDSDYFAAVEDAIVLGCDSANLSLGSVYPGWSESTGYSAILNKLVETGTLVMVTSAGNSYGWMTNTATGYLYGDDVSFHTGGNPGAFSNTFAVASVDNVGATGAFLTVDGGMVFYTESSYTNEPITSIGRAEAYEFVYVDGVGTDEQFNALKDVVAGKVALCNRGETSFYMKAEAAVAAGAVATIVVNNQDGTISMDLSSYTKTQPVVSITQADGALFRTGEKKEENGVGYWTGSVVIGSKVGSGITNKTGYYTISSFSSWGVPQSLTLKPEITAPGGNIYSVFGQNQSSSGGIAGGYDQYEGMSGTSMAAPQVSGMVALVNQALEAKGYVKEINRRTLALSLLMSTAVPMEEDFKGEENSVGVTHSYYSVLRQGAGLANVGNAVSAQSYILMDENATASYADGKVKAELGESKNGKFSYSFTLNNLNGVENSYTLSTDLFTQDLFEDEGELWLDTWTAALEADVVYTIDGEIFVPRAGVDADVTKDGVTDAKDAKAVLEYIVGKNDGSELDLKAGDLDGDGKLTSYDAHLILAKMETEAFTVPANGKVNVQVDMQITSDLSDYVNGAYVEGYTFVNPVATEEGALDVTHSIPILGFYGNWTDASMFEHGTYVEKLYGDTSVPYCASATANRNYLTYTSDGATYYQIGNPYGIEEGGYPEGKAAIRSTDTVYQVSSILIRNAALTGAVIMDAKTNEVLYSGSLSAYGTGTRNLGAYFYVSGNAWRNNTAATVTLNQQLSKLKVKEGQTIKVGYVAIPEYYLSDLQKGTTAASAEEFKRVLESGALGEGAFMGATLKIDDTAPVITKIDKDLMTGDITVTASDNEDIAYMAVLTRSGTRIYADVLAPAKNADGTVTYTFPVGDAGIGSKCMVLAADYAGNETPVIVEYGGEDPDYTNAMFAALNTSTTSTVFPAEFKGTNWVVIDPSTVNVTGNGANVTGMTPYAPANGAVQAAEYIDGYVFYVIGANLYVAPLDELESPMLIANLTKSGVSSSTSYGISDLAYNQADGKLYGIDGYSTSNTLWEINPLTGVAKNLGAVAVNNSQSTNANIRSFTIAPDGTFYGVTKHSTSAHGRLVKWTMPEESTATIAAEIVSELVSGTTYPNENYGTLAWDRASGKMYLAVASYASTTASATANYLWVIDPSDGSVERANEGALLYYSAQAMFIVADKSVGGPGFGETSTVSELTLSASTDTLYVGGSDTLTFSISPWTLSDKTVTWTSADPEIATVNDEGVVTGVKPGATTITATANADGKTTATCAVTVNPLPEIEVTALIYGTDSKATWSDYNVSDVKNWKAIPGASADSYLAGGIGLDQIVYVHDGSTMYGIDPDTFEVSNYGTIASSWTWSDAAPAPAVLASEGFQIIGLCNSGTMVELLIPAEGSLSYWDLSSSFANDPMAAIAYAYSTGTYDYYYMITESGALYRIYFNTAGNMYRGTWGVTGLDLTGVSAVDGSNYASMYYSGTSTGGYLVLTTYADGDDSAKMNLIQVGSTAATTKLLATTEFGEEVWPVVSNYSFARATELTIKTTDPETLDLYAGSSYEYNVKVVAYKETNAVTWTSSNPAVATVENGLIKAVAEGTATITVETVETNANGEKVRRDITVNVAPVYSLDTNATMGAQIVTGSGTAWADINLGNLTTKTNKSSSVTLIGGGKYNGVFYGRDASNTFYAIDAETLAVKDSYALNTTYAPVDATGASTLSYKLVDSGETGEVLGLPMWVAGNGYIAMYSDPENRKLGAFNFSSYGLNFVGIAYDGEVSRTLINDAPEAGESDEAAIVYIMDSTGMVYMGVLYATSTGTGITLFYLNNSPVIKTKTDANYSMEVISTDASTPYTDTLIIAEEINGAANIYAVDLLASNPVAKYIGTLDGVTAISTLFSDSYAEKKASAVLPSAFTSANLLADVQMETIDLSAVSASTAPETEEGTAASSSAKIDAQTANQIGGTLNKVAVEDTDPDDNVREGVVVDTANKTVTLYVTTTETTNGKALVDYDKDVLTLVKATSGNAAVTAINDTDDGSVEIAFANKKNFEGSVAALEFTYDVTVLQTEVTIKTVEDGSDLDAKDEETVPVKGIPAIQPGNPLDPGFGVVTYEIKLKDEDSTWTPGDEGGLTFTTTADSADIVTVMVDGEEVEYILNEDGSMTLSPDFLATLSAGEHTLTVIFSNGTSASVTFIIGKPTPTQTPAPSVTIPATGDSMNLTLLVVLAMISVLGMGTLVVVRKHNN